MASPRDPKSFQSLCCYNLVGSKIWWTHLPNGKSNKDAKKKIQKRGYSNYKVKFMCSYNGKTQPRPHDNQLAYVGGETKILAVNRNIKFNAIKSKLSSICNDADFCFKYQLPGEDLDALISVTNDEDLKHMMLKYDRLLRGSAKPARLRLFLFAVNSALVSFSTNNPKSER